jgi:hypothetical protein
MAFSRRFEKIGRWHGLCFVQLSTAVRLPGSPGVQDIISSLEDTKMKHWSRMVTLGAGLLLSAGATTSAMAQENSPDAMRCVNLSRIKSTEILSDKQIVFETVGGNLYVNSMPYSCPGMRPDSVLMYRTSLDQLCNVDVVTILEPMVDGFYPGASCGLGKFEPVNKAQVAQLRAAAKAAS